MTRPELYLHTWDQLIDKELGRALAELRESCENIPATLGRQGWDMAEVERLLNIQHARDLPGEQVFLLTPQDLTERSYTQNVVAVKRAIVNNLSTFSSIRALAEFLGKNDKYLAGLKDL